MTKFATAAFAASLVLSAGTLPAQANPAAFIAPAMQMAQQMFRQAGGQQQGQRPQGQPYAGALRRGGCKDPGATFINEKVGCVRRVSDPAIMEKYRGKISDICRHPGDNVVVLPDGGRAHYMCP